MKLLHKQIFALAMVFCLLAGLGVTAYADKTTSVTATVGKEFSYSETISDALSSMQLRGECPGLTFGGTSQGFTIFGTPTTAGTYTLETVVDKSAGGSDTYTVNITVNNADGSAPSSNTNSGGGEQAVIVPDSGDNTPTNNGEVTITKHPTGETVEEGGTALFVARADNATEIIWRLVSPDTTNTYTAKEAPAYFAGLSVTISEDGETLTLSGITYSLNRWCAEAKFMGEGGPVYSNGARITVQSETLPTPTISNQPAGASLELGKTTTLSVTATVADGTLHYQWYKNDTNRNSGGTVINGATSSSYTPPETSGTTYYYVNVWSADDTRESTHVNSAVAAVQYPAAPTPATQTGGNTTQTGGNTTQTGGNTTQTGGSTTQTGGNTTQTGTDSQGEENTSSPAVVTTAEPDGVRTTNTRRSNSTLIILILVLAAVLLAACVSLFFLRRGQHYDDE